MDNQYIKHILPTEIVSSFFKTSNFVAALFEWQLEHWPLAAQRFRKMSEVKTRNLFIDGSCYTLQFNPARAVSATANVDPMVVANRPCFLCGANLPKEQMGFEIEAGYLFLINPFPIFDPHFTIIATSHVPQRIENRISSFLSIAKKISGYSIFYNGPESGASAPDHFHFQAMKNNILPLESRQYQWITKHNDTVKIGLWLDSACSIVVLQSENMELLNSKLEHLISLLPKHGTLSEPMMNIIMRFNDNRWTVFVIPRSKHRPWQYHATDSNHCIISPASVDFGGFIVLPRESDFLKLNADMLADMLNQGSISNQIISDIAKRIINAA